MNKEILRKKLLVERKLVQEPRLKSQLIFEHLKSSIFWKNARRVCSYMSIGSEVHTDCILDQALLDSKELYLPWINSEGHLSVSQVQSSNDLVRGTFGILEPKKEMNQPNSRQPFPAKELDIILVPGVGFDRKGNRIGYGKGYYDRFLSTIGDSTITIGLAFESQIVPDIPVDANDQSLKYLISENGLFCCIRVDS